MAPFFARIPRYSPRNAWRAPAAHLVDGGRRHANQVARPLIGDIPIVATRLYPHLGGLAESPRSERAQRRLGATAYCPRAAWARVIAVATLRSPEASFGRGRRALTPPAAEPRPHRQPGVRARFRVSPASGEKRVARVDLARLLSSSRRRPAVLSDWRQSTAPPAPAPAIPLPRMQSPAPAQPRRVQRRPSAISRRAGASASRRRASGRCRARAGAASGFHARQQPRVPGPDDFYCPRTGVAISRTGPAALPGQLDRLAAEPLRVRGMHAWHGHHILSVGGTDPSDQVSTRLGTLQ